MRELSFQAWSYKSKKRKQTSRWFHLEVGDRYSICNGKGQPVQPEKHCVATWLLTGHVPVNNSYCGKCLNVWIKYMCAKEFPFTRCQTGLCWFKYLHGLPFVSAAHILLCYKMRPRFVLRGKTKYFIVEEIHQFKKADIRRHSNIEVIEVW